MIHPNAAHALAEAIQAHAACELAYLRSLQETAQRAGETLIANSIAIDIIDLSQAAETVARVFGRQHPAVAFLQHIA